MPDTALAEYQEVFDRLGVPEHLRTPENYFFEAVTFTPKQDPKSGQQPEAVTEFFAIPRFVYLHKLPIKIAEDVSDKPESRTYQSWIGQMNEAGSVVALNAKVDPEASIDRRVIVRGEAQVVGKCVLSPDVEIGAEARLIDAKVGHEAYIGDAALVRESTIGIKTRIKLLASLYGSTIGNLCLISEHTDLDYGSELGDGCIVGPRNKLGSSACFGHHVSTGEDCTFNEGVKVLARTTFAKKVTVGKNSSVGSDGEIGENNYIGEDSQIGNDFSSQENCRIDDSVVIGNSCSFADRVIVELRVVIGNDLVAMQHAQISDDAVVGNSCRLGEESVVGFGAVLEDSVQLDPSSHSGHNSTLRQGSRVLEGIHLKNKTKIRRQRLVYDSTKYLLAKRARTALKR